MPIDAMKGELEAYFAALCGLGERLLASDAAGRDVPLARAVSWSLSEAERAKRDGGRIFFVGNGGSASIASHMAIDWMKNGGFAACAFNDAASLTCLANDLGYEQVFALPLSRHAGPGDLVCAISSSGKSPNIVAGVKAARARGAKVLTLSGFSPDNPLRKLGDMNLYVPSSLYGFVEIAHLTLLHALLDLSMGWRAEGREPAYAAT